MKKITLILFIIIVLTAVFLQTREEKPQTATAYSLGTIIRIAVWGEDDDTVLSQTIERIKDIERKITKKMTTDDEVQSIVTRSIYYARLSHGSFDPTIRPIVKLWGIGTNKERIPSEEEIKEALSLVGYEKIESADGDRIDLGGIAKGYCADQAVLLLRSHGVERALIDLGGNIFAMGERPGGGPWRIGIQDPYEPRGEYIGALSVIDSSVVTSGTYERYFKSGEKIYHHIMDPATGRPSQSGLASVTIVSPHSIDGDALSTAVFVMGLERGMSLIESLEGIEAIIVRDRDIFLSSGLSGFELKDDRFEVK